jgi:uncharacterized protein
MTDIKGFVDDVKDINKTLRGMPSFTMEVTLTDECNFRCTYCFEGDDCLKQTSLDCVDDIFKSIDVMLSDTWFLSSYKDLRIGFWGGEPTLRPDILQKFVGRYKDNDFVTFYIYTNGYNVDALMDVFGGCKDKIDIQVSYDGEKIHDLKRFTAGGNKTASRVRDNIYRLHENGFNIKIKSTVTYDTMEHMAECWDDVKRIHDDIDGVRYSPTVDYHSSEIIMDMDKVRKCFVAVAKKDLEFYKENGYYLFSWFGSRGPVRCGFFKYGMSINTNGDMSYCHGCDYSSCTDDMCFGNISDGDVISKIKHNNDYFDVPKKVDGCEGCIVTQCSACNVTSYEHSKKKDFLGRWFDLSCQKNQCDMFREFSKVSISLKDILGRS